MSRPRNPTPLDATIEAFDLVERALRANGYAAGDAPKSAYAHFCGIAVDFLLRGEPSANVFTMLDKLFGLARSGRMSTGC